MERLISVIIIPIPHRKKLEGCKKYLLETIKEAKVL